MTSMNAHELFGHTSLLSLTQEKEALQVAYKSASTMLGAWTCVKWNVSAIIHYTIQTTLHTGFQCKHKELIETS